MCHGAAHAPTSSFPSELPLPTAAPAPPLPGSGGLRNRRGASSRVGRIARTEGGGRQWPGVAAGRNDRPRFKAESVNPCWYVTSRQSAASLRSSSSTSGSSSSSVFPSPSSIRDRMCVTWFMCSPRNRPERLQPGFYQGSIAKAIFPCRGRRHLSRAARLHSVLIPGRSIVGLRFNGVVRSVVRAAQDNSALRARVFVSRAMN